LIANTITLNGADTIDTQANGITLTGPIGGTGGLIKTGTGRLVLSGNNTYSGATNVNAGTLGAGAATALSSASAFTIAAGATLDLSGVSPSIGSLAGAGTVTNSGSTAILTTGGDNTSTTFSGIVQNGLGVMSLTKAGTGTFTLSGTSTYTGATTVNGGTLAVTGDIRTSSGVTVNGGAFLSGTGTVSNININAGGTLAAGLPSAPGTLTATGSLVLQAAATSWCRCRPRPRAARRSPAPAPEAPAPRP
jgi:autotransporter-associated beta strand protein